MSKGSNPRPVDKEKFDDSFDRIFKQAGFKPFKDLSTDEVIKVLRKPTQEVSE